MGPSNFVRKGEGRGGLRLVWAAWTGEWVGLSEEREGMRRSGARWEEELPIREWF